MGSICAICASEEEYRAYDDDDEISYRALFKCDYYMIRKWWWNERKKEEEENLKINNNFERSWDDI